MSDPAQTPLPATVDLPPAPDQGQISTNASANDSVPANDRASHTAPVVLPPGFELLRVLGRGGMGVVYGAHQTALKRDVAIKMILADRSGSESQRARFRAEVEAVARFQHPNIVQIFEVGEVGGVPFCVLEYVDGGTLGAFLDDKPIAPEAAARLAEGLARAVHYAHQRQIIHRDLKPGNILMTKDGTPKITDFGVAKQLDDDTGQTQDGQVVGTPRYMAPEQARGELHNLGPHTDVYALGVILYEMLTGAVPFRGEGTPETLRKVQFEEPPPPRKAQPRIPVALETICLKCLRKAPADRYSSALALAQDLERFLAGEPILARPEGAVRKGLRLLRKRRTAVLSAVAVLFAALVVVYFAHGARKQQQIAVQEREIESEFKLTKWVPAEVDRIEARIAGLERAAPERAARLRDEMLKQYRQSFLDRLTKSELNETDWATIEDIKRDLSTRNPDLAADLSRRVNERRGQHIRFLDLEPPFAGFETIFAPNHGLTASATELLRLAADPHAIATKAPSGGAVKVEIRFEKWEEATQLGVTLSTTRDSSYQFLITAQPDSDRPTVPLGQARNRGGLHLVVKRNDFVLQRLPVAVRDGALMLRATRTGDRLSLQANDVSPLECLDPFPLSDAGDVGFVWPAKVSAVRIIGTRQLAPLAPNPLEQGNLLVVQGKDEDALRFFQQFRATATDPVARAEARYKIAVCLTRLKRFDEAARLLEAVDDAPPGRWSAMCLYQLWLVYLEQGNLDKGSAAFRLLKAQYPPEELLYLIPGSDLTAIWRKYDVPRTDLIFAENVVERMKTLVEVSDLLRRLNHLSVSNWALCVQLLDRAYQLEGKPDKALVLLTDALKSLENLPETDLKLVAQYHLLEDYLWLLGVNGNRTFALAEVKRYQPPDRDQSYTAYRLRIALAFHTIRLLAQEKRWAEAEAEIDRCAELLRHPVVDGHHRTSQAGTYYYHSTLQIMRGLIREQLGDTKGTEEAFRKGTRAAYRESLPPAERVWRLDVDSNTIRDNLCMAARIGALTDAEATEERDRILALFVDSANVSAMVGLVPIPPEAFRKMWLLPSGRVIIRKIIFREMNYSEVTWGPIKQLLIAGIHVEAITDLTPEHEELLRTLVDRLAELIQQRKFGRGALVKLGNTWINGLGAMGSLGWEGFKPQIPKDVLGSVAYLLGHRYLKLNRPKEAAQFFQITLDNETDGSNVKRLAKEQLSRLKDKGK